MVEHRDCEVAQYNNSHKIPFDGRDEPCEEGIGDANLDDLLDEEVVKGLSWALASILRPSIVGGPKECDFSTPQENVLVTEDILDAGVHLVGDMLVAQEDPADKRGFSLGYILDELLRIHGNAMDTDAGA